jgi:signal transduction histidine kinase
VKELGLQVARYSKLEVVCTSKGRERPLEKEIGVALYRCCQESISNAVRHAEATRLTVQVRYSDREVHVTVEDNGKGFDPRDLYDSSGRMMSSGFWTIRQRMADLGGAFRLSTARGQGTVVEVIVPYKTRESHAKRKNKTAHSG